MAVCSAEYVGRRPERCRSLRASSPSALKRWMRLRTVSPSRPTRAAMADALSPQLARQMICARCTRWAGAVWEWANLWTAAHSAGVKSRKQTGAMGHLRQQIRRDCHYTPLPAGCTTKPRLRSWREYERMLQDYVLPD